MMNTHAPRPSDCVYVVKLHVPDPLRPQRMSGRVEHVASGRRHDFDNAQALLACIAHEQQQAALADADECAAPAPVTPTRSAG